MKKLRKIEQWKEFLIAWEKVKTLAEAKGLLYEGASFQGKNLSVEDFREMISFYYRTSCAGTVEEPLSIIAIQLMARKLLSEALGVMWRGNENPKSAKEIISIISYFLHQAKVRENLKTAPYPRFIGEFLFHISQNCKRYQEAAADIYDFTVFIESMLTWGVPGCLVGLQNVCSPSILFEGIRNHLEDKKISLEVLEEISNKMDIYDNFSDYKVNTHILRNTYLVKEYFQKKLGL